MRMFLVGMCDIFLILYITTLNQLEGRKMSTLTVSDYQTLEKNVLELKDFKKQIELDLAKTKDELSLSESIRNQLREEQTQLSQEIDSSKRLLEEKNKSLEKSETQRLEAAELARQSKQQALEFERQKEEAAESAIRERQKAEQAEIAKIAALAQAAVEKESARQTTELARAETTAALAEVARTKLEHENALELIRIQEQTALDVRTEIEEKEQTVIDLQEQLERESSRAEEVERQMTLVESEKLAALERLQKDIELMAREKELTQKMAEKASLIESELQLTQAKGEKIASTNIELREQLERLKEEHRTLKSKSEALEQEQAVMQAELDQTRQASEQAQAEARRAKQTAAIIKQSAKVARTLARNMQDSVEQAKDDAAQAKAVASQTAQKLESVVQPSKVAVKQHIEGKLLTIDIELRGKGSFSRDHSRQLTLLPVKVGKEAVAFLPLSHFVIDTSTDPDSIKSFSISYGSRRAQSIYVSPTKPKIVALVVSDSVPAADLLTHSSEFTNWMPTLVALRNGQGERFADRIRDVSDENFVFKRDTLKATASNIYKFSRQGIRGTGDYAEHILLGDQIVDLNGNFIGLATEEDQVQHIAHLKGWKKVDLSLLNTATDVRRIQKALR